MNLKKISQVLLIVGLLVVLVGCVLSLAGYKLPADILMGVGFVLVILRGALRSRER